MFAFCSSGSSSDFNTTCIYNAFTMIYNDIGGNDNIFKIIYNQNKCL